MTTIDLRTTSGAATLPRLISIDEAAELLAVSSSTVRNWINDEAIPYVVLPGGTERRQYRIPLQGLLNTLSGNYDLAAELRRVEEATQGATRLTEPTSRGARRGEPPREAPDDHSGGLFASAAARDQ